MITIDQIIDSGFPDNNTQDITAEVLRNTLKMSFIVNELLLRTSLVLPKNPSVVEIEAAITDSNYPMPISSDRSIYLYTGNSKMFNIAFNKDSNEYFFKEMKKAN